MAKQKRINKNLFAFLTIMGVVVVVSIAALVIKQTTRKDPSVLARNAKQLEDTADPDKLEKAARMYQQAYQATDERETRYLLDVARVALKLGMIGDWLNTLKKVNSKTPDDPAPLIAIIDGLWRLRAMAGTGFFWNEWRDTADNLLLLAARTALPDDQKAAAAAIRAWGLWNAGATATGDESRESPEVIAAWGATAEESVAKAHELAPTNPVVAVTRVEALRRALIADIEKARAANAAPSELERMIRGFPAVALAALEPALEQSPNDVMLIETMMELVRQDYGALLGEGKDEEALAALDRAIRHVDAALAKSPDSPELNFAKGRLLADQLSVLVRDGQLEKAEPLRTAIAELASRSAALDPAMYQAYTLHADVLILPADPKNDNEAAQRERFGKALAIYEDARDRTLTLRSLRASLNQFQRQLLLFRGFTAAIALHDLTLRGGGDAAALLPRARAFLEDAQARMPEMALTSYMEGTYRVAENDLIGAIKSYEKAHETVKGLPDVISGASTEGALWLRVLRANALPAERLAALYRAGGELGEAMRYAELAMRQYDNEAQLLPPRRLVTDAADLALQLKDARKSLEILDHYRSFFESDRDYIAQRAKTLAALGRGAEAAQLSQQIAGSGEDESLDARLWQARQALDVDDFERAAELAKAVIAVPDASETQILGALQIVMTVAEKSQKQEETLAYVRSLLDAKPRDAIARLLKSFEIVLGEKDPAKRDEQLLKLIDENPDPAARAERRMNFHAARGRYEEALKSCDELRKLRPDDDRALASEFSLRIELKQIDQAAALIPKLTQSDEGRGFDRAGGATFRARLAMARGEPELAVRELRQAIQALPTSTELQLALAEALVGAGKTEDAIDALTRAIEANPRSVRAHGLLVDAYDELANRASGQARESYQKQAEAVFESLAKLAPDNPFVVARRQLMAENKNPRDAIRKRLADYEKDPNDLKNIGRLGELFRQAYVQATEARDERAKAEVLQSGNDFFDRADKALRDPSRLSLVRLAADFFAVTQQRDRGEQFLRNYIDTTTDGGGRILGQVVLARLLELAHDLPEAERAYQQAQVMVRDYTTPDAEQLERVRSRVGLEMIDFYQRSGRPLDVVEACNWFINLMGDDRPEVGEVRLRLVDAYIGARLLDDARRELDRYFQKYGSTVPGLAARARLNLMSRPTRDLAYQDLTAILQQDPQNVWALITRGWLSLRRARFDAARDDLLAARPLLTPQAPLANRLYVLLAEYYEAVRQPDQAIEALRAHLDAVTKRELPIEQREPVVVELVNRLRKYDRLDEAQRLISEYMERYPNSPRWPELLAEAIYARGEAAERKGDATAAARDFITAANYFARASERFGENELLGMSMAFARRLEAMARGNQAREALAAYQQFPISKLAIRPANVPEPAWPLVSARIRSAMLPAVGRVQWMLNDQNAARTQFRQALQDAAEAHYSILRDVIDKLLTFLPIEEVESLLQAAADAKAPGTPAGQLLRISLADHWQRMSMRPGAPADELRRKALDLLAEVDKVAGANAIVLGTMLLERAQILDAMGNEKGAIEAYEQALRLDENNRVALNNLAYMLTSAKDAGLRQPETAVKLAERLAALIEDDDNAAPMFDTLGWVYYQYALSAKDRRDKLDVALEMLQQSLALKTEENYDAHAHLAQVLAELGRAGEARSVLERGIGLARAAGDAADQKRLEELLNKIR